ncbi:MAG: thioredoxin family protein [Candidatus Eremiobacterota bacterium]
MRCLSRLAVLALACLTLACGGSKTPQGATQTPTPSGPDLKIANASSPGERLDLATCAVPGKLTLIEFFSDRCPPCREMARVLDYIAARRPDLAIRRLNIDRPGSGGIDWDSPLADQYGIDTVPCFKIYGTGGGLISQGDAAKDQVRQWYYDAQMLDRAQADPGTRAISERYR